MSDLDAKSGFRYLRLAISDSFANNSQLKTSIHRWHSGCWLFIDIGDWSYTVSEDRAFLTVFKVGSINNLISHTC